MALNIVSQAFLAAEPSLRNNGLKASGIKQTLPRNEKKLFS
jgi:hypothetical protein